VKTERQKAIKNIMESKDVKTQQDLLGELKKVGIEATQATISRDLEKLGFDKIKNQGVYSLIKESVSEDKMEYLKRMFKDFVKEIKENENIIAIKTSTGNAQGVALAIDEANLPEIIGTVGGDDTIMLIVAKGILAEKVVEKFKRMIE
jgi:transcriptional regulator of arginine metabolism